MSDEIRIAVMTSLIDGTRSVGTVVFKDKEFLDEFVDGLSKHPNIKSFKIWELGGLVASGHKTTADDMKLTAADLDKLMALIADKKAHIKLDNALPLDFHDSRRPKGTVAHTGWDGNESSGWVDDQNNPIADFIEDKGYTNVEDSQQKIPYDLTGGAVEALRKEFGCDKEDGGGTGPF